MTNDARFNVLVAGDVSTLATGHYGDIPVDTLGFYNARTNSAITAIDPSSYTEAVKDGFYVAIKRTMSDGSTMLLRSLGTIYPNKFKSYEQNCYTAYQPKIIDFSGANIDFDTEYAISFRLKNPDLFKGINGGDFSFIIAYTTESQTSPSQTEPNIAAMFNSFKTQLENEKGADFISLEFLNPSDDSAIADLDAWCASNPGVAPKMRFTINQYTYTPPVDEFYNYIQPTEIEVDIYPIEGFENNGTVTVVQEMVYEQGAGREVRELERMAGGWNGNPGPYRELSFSLKKIRYASDEAGKYALYNIHYLLETKGGSPIPHYEDALLTIAIPSTNTDLMYRVRQMLGALIYADVDAFTQQSCETVPA